MTYINVRIHIRTVHVITYPSKYLGRTVFTQLYTPAYYAEGGISVNKSALIILIKLQCHHVYIYFFISSYPWQTTMDQIFQLNIIPLRRPFLTLIYRNDIHRYGLYHVRVSSQGQNNDFFFIRNLVTQNFSGI